MKFNNRVLAWVNKGTLVHYSHLLPPVDRCNEYQNKLGLAGKQAHSALRHRYISCNVS